MLLLGASASLCRGADSGPALQPVPTIPADLPTEAMFDRAHGIDDFEGPTPRWAAAGGGQNTNASVHRDTSQSHGGQASLRVDYEFVGKRDFEYIQLNAAADFAQPGLGFGFRLKHDGTPFALRLRFADASGECHQTELSGLPQPGWQFVACALDAHSTAWGGDGNRQKNYPCKLVGICVDRPASGFTGKGSLWIDDAAILRPSAAHTKPLHVAAHPKSFGNLYAVGDALTLRASGEGERVRWTVTDYFGSETARGEGAAGGTEARFTLQQPGWYCAKFELLSGDRVVGTHLFPCAALPGGTESTRSDFVGMCSHFGQQAYPLETMKLMRDYGIDQFRDEISWLSCETEKGKVTVPPFAAAYLQRAAELKMRPLIIYDYHNPFHDNGGFPNSPEAIAGFANYAVELTRQTRGQVAMFEVWNEWIGGCGMGGHPGIHDGASYGRLLKPVYEAVKKSFPEVTVAGIGGEYGPRCAEHILDAVGTAGPTAMDAWSIHPYRYPRSPESSDLAGEVRGIAEKVAAAGVKTKAWITEIGYPTHRASGGTDLATQAPHTVRTLALLQAMPEVAKVFWYDFKDDGLTREYNEHNFGLVHHQQFHCAPKPAIVATSAFIRMTGGAVPQGLRKQGDVHVVAYRKPDGSDVLVAWSSKDPAPATLDGEGKRLFNMMGAPLPPADTVELGMNPVYLTGRDLRIETPRRP